MNNLVEWHVLHCISWWGYNQDCSCDFAKQSQAQSIDEMIPFKD
jgi:hypothetical protein